MTTLISITVTDKVDMYGRIITVYTVTYDSAVHFTADAVKAAIAAAGCDSNVSAARKSSAPNVITLTSIR